MRTMFDALNPYNIPTSAAMVASYIDSPGHPAPGWEARFPHAVIVKIARDYTNNDGHVYDVERGAGTVLGAVEWVKLRRAHGADPTVYTFQANWQTVRAAFQSEGVPEPHYWIAAWNEQASMLPGAVAHQYVNDVVLRAGYDLSVVADYWPGVDSSQPTPTPAPGPDYLEDEMSTFLVRSTPADGGTGAIGLVLDGHFTHLSDPRSAAGLQAAGIREAEVADADYRAIATALGASSGGE